MSAADTQRSLDRVERQLELAHEKKDWDRIVRLERRRDEIHAKAFRAHMKRVRALPGGPK